MSKLFSFLTVCAGLCLNSVSAQQILTAKNKLDLHLGYGVVPQQNLQKSYSESLVPGLADVRYVDLSLKGNGTLSAGFLYHLSDKLALGADVYYAKNKSEFSYSNSSTQVPVSTWKSLLVHARYTYLRQIVNIPNFELYGAVSVGGSSVNSEITRPNGSVITRPDRYLAYQVTPFGIRTGRQLGFWAEVGYGYKGILHCGLSLRL